MIIEKRENVSDWDGGRTVVESKEDAHVRLGSVENPVSRIAVTRRIALQTFVYSRATLAMMLLMREPSFCGRTSINTMVGTTDVTCDVSNCFVHSWRSSKILGLGPAQSRFRKHQPWLEDASFQLVSY